MCKIKEPLIKSFMSRIAADCGRRGIGGIPAPEACAHRVMPPIPQSRVRGHVGLNKRFLRTIAGMALCVLSISSAHALDEPNDNYSSLVLSLRSQSFSDPVCIGNECHTGWAGPAAVFSQQVIPNLALGLSGSYLQSSGAFSSITSTGVAVFVEAIAGVGSFVDVGASVAALDSKVQMSSSNPAFSSSAHDTGNDVGVFGKVFLTDTRSVSVTLSYDAISYQKASSQSVVGVSLVTIMAKHHRLALSVDKVRDSNGKLVSGGTGFGYSYLF